jgi:hypothetical protein
MDCKVIEGMEVIGITNARLRFRFPDTISFADCEIIPLCPSQRKADVPGQIDKHRYGDKFQLSYD